MMKRVRMREKDCRNGTEKKTEKQLLTMPIVSLVLGYQT